MMYYSSSEQINIFAACNESTSLLVAREVLEEMQSISKIAMLFYNLRMQNLSNINRI